MPRFTVSPNDAAFPSAELIAPDGARVLTIIQNLDCKEADVSRDVKYSFSARLGENGVWMIFRRELARVPGNISTFG